MKKIRVSLWVNIISALLIVVTMNIIGVEKWLTSDQTDRLISLLSGSIIGSSIYAFIEILKFNERKVKEDC